MRIFLLLLGLAILFFMALFAVSAGTKAYDQYQTRHFAQTEGVVIKSEVKATRGSKGQYYYEPIIDYRYSINEQTHLSSTIDLGNSANNRKNSSAIVNENPPGRKITVYYDPDHPEVSVLRTDFGGKELMPILFLTLMSAFGFGCLGSAIVMFRQSLFPDTAGAPIRRRGPLVTSVYLPEAHPLAAILATLFAGCFAALLIVVFAIGENPPVLAPVIAWILTIALTLYVAVRNTRRMLSDTDDLILDLANGTISFPCVYGRKQKISVPLRSVKGARMELKHGKTSKGTPTTTYQVMIDLQSGETYKILDWPKAARAEGFLRWLQSQLQTS